MRENIDFIKYGVYSEGASLLLANLVTINIILLSSLFLNIGFNWLLIGFILMSIIWIFNLFYFGRKKRYYMDYRYFKSSAGRLKYNENLGWTILLIGFIVRVIKILIFVIMNFNFKSAF